MPACPRHPRRRHLTTTRADTLAPLSTQTWLQYGIVCLIFSITWLAIRISLQDFPPLGGAGLRYLVACPILFVVARIRGVAFPTTWHGWRIPLLLGVTMFAIPFALIYWAEQTVPSGLTSVLFATNAIFVALFAHHWLHDERITVGSIAGIAVGFIGVVVVFWDRLSLHAAWLGEAAIVLTALIQGTSGVIVRRHPETPPLVLSCIGTGVGALLLLAASFMFERGLFAHVTPSGVAAVLFLAVFGSVIAFTLVISLIHRIGANRVASTVYVTPTLAMIWGAMFMGETVGPRLAVGSALVLGGVWLTNRMR